MKINDFIKYRNFVESNDFYSRYKSTKLFLSLFSWIGTGLLIFFGYFLLYDLLKPIIDSYVNNNNLSTYISSIASFILIMSFELVKRSYINTFSYNFVRDGNKLLYPETKINLMIVSVLITLSTILSVNGVARFSNTNKKMNEMTEVNLGNYSDSLFIKYQPEIQSVKNEINILKETNKKILTKILDTKNIWVKNKLKEEISFNDNRINKLNNNVDKLKSERDSLISVYENKLVDKTNDIKKENKTMGKYFKFTSILFEIFVFVGIYFSVLFNFNSFIDNQHKYEKYLKEFEDKKKLLDILYLNGNVNIGDSVMSMTELHEKVKMDIDVNVSKTFSDDFYKDLDRMKVIRINTSQDKEFLMDYQEALKKLNEISKHK